jgi:hypothetical protein
MSELKCAHHMAHEKINLHDQHHERLLQLKVRRSQMTTEIVWRVNHKVCSTRRSQHQLRGKMNDRVCHYISLQRLSENQGTATA